MCNESSTMGVCHARPNLDVWYQGLQKSRHLLQRPGYKYNTGTKYWRDCFRGLLALYGLRQCFGKWDVLLKHQSTLKDPYSYVPYKYKQYKYLFFYYFILIFHITRRCLNFHSSLYIVIRFVISTLNGRSIQRSNYSVIVYTCKYKNQQYLSHKKEQMVAFYHSLKPNEMPLSSKSFPCRSDPQSPISLQIPSSNL